MSMSSFKDMENSWGIWPPSRQEWESAWQLAPVKCSLCPSGSLSKSKHWWWQLYQMSEWQNTKIYIQISIWYSSLFPVRYWKDREDIVVNWGSCTKSSPKYSYKHKKVFEFNVFQPGRLSFEVSLSFTSEFFVSLPVHLHSDKNLCPLFLYNVAMSNSLCIPAKQAVAAGMIPACNYCPGIVFIHLFLCNLDKCGLLNMAKMNEAIISGQDTRQAGWFDLQGYVNKYQWHVLFFRLLNVSLCFWAVVSARLWIHLLLLSFAGGSTAGLEGKQGGSSYLSHAAGAIIAMWGRCCNLGYQKFKRTLLCPQAGKYSNTQCLGSATFLLHVVFSLS